MRIAMLSLSIASFLVLAPTAATRAQADDSSGQIRSVLDLAEHGEVTGAFEYHIPDEAAASPSLAARLEAERGGAQADFEEGRAAFMRDAPGSQLGDAFTWHKEWDVMGRSGSLLSLAAIVYSFEGGAHGNTGFDALLWDVARDDPIDVTALFTDRYLGLAHLDRAFCARLRTMQIERFEGEVDEPWAECPLLHELAIVPAGAPAQPFTQIKVLVPPYVAGPYAMGSFEIDLPVDAALIAMLRPEYREAFAAR